MTEMTEMNETDLMHEIMYHVSLAGNKIFRANVGQVKMADGRYFNTGLPKGFSDLFGYRPDGQVFFIEVKIPGGRIRPEQQKFIDAMAKSGALAGVAHNVEEAMEIVRGHE